MDTLNNLMKEIKNHNFYKRFSCLVDITHINNPHSFYVRPRAYIDYLGALQAPGQRIPASEINVGDVIIFKSKTLKNYVRGSVIKISDGSNPKYDLLAMDVGCYEQSVSLRRIWGRQNPIDVVGLVTHCRLADCAPLGDTWDDQAIDAMKFYVKGERTKLIVRSVSNDSVTVEIYNTSPDDIATLLALTGYTTLGYVTNNMDG